jgi:uncharacterized protein involved in exopolysaccharide biosynthesis
MKYPALLAQHLPGKGLKRRLAVRPVRNTEIIEICATGERPGEAAQIANAVAQAYSEYRAERRKLWEQAGLEALRKRAEEQVPDETSEFQAQLKMKIEAEQKQLAVGVFPAVEILKRAVPPESPIGPNRLLVRCSVNQGS